MMLFYALCVFLFLPAFIIAFFSWLRCRREGADAIIELAAMAALGLIIAAAIIHRLTEAV